MEVITGKERYRDKTILCLGDSITSDYSSDNTSWVQMLRETLPVKEIYNNGLGGTMIAKSEGRNGDSFVERHTKMQPSADVVIVYGGINDFNHAVPLGELLSEDITTFYGALNVICKNLIEKYTSADIMFITPMHAFGFKDYPHWDTKNAAGKKLIDYRNAVMETCQWYSIPVLDLFSVSGMTPDVKANKELYLPDGLHPQLEGRKKLARKLLNFLLYEL